MYGSHVRWDFLQRTFLGMLVGYLLKSKTPEGLLNTLAFVIFSVFGVYTLLPGTEAHQHRCLSDPGAARYLWQHRRSLHAVCVRLFTKKREKGKIGS